MIPKTIKNSLMTTLQNDAGLKDYVVKEYFEGARTDVRKESFPFIVVELVRNKERPETLNANTRLDLEFAVQGFTYDTDVDNQLNRVLDFENLIKKALCADVTLGGVCDNVYFTNTEYSIELYPVRAFIITAVVQYKQNFTTRV